MMKIKKPIPFAFALDALEGLDYVTRPMFGCTAVYLGSKIVLVLRSKDDHADDNGVWIATEREHHEGLREEFPMMRSISFLGKAPTAWQVLPESDPGFEAAVLRACELIREGDPRMGKTPKPKARRMHKPKPRRTSK